MPPSTYQGHDTGKVYIYYTGYIFDTNFDTIISSSTYYFSRIIANAGDINKDNIKDFFISDGGSDIFLYLGIDSLVKINITNFGFGGGYVNIQADCDINNDGYYDFIIGNSSYKNSNGFIVGGAFVYLGNNTLDTIPTFKIEGEDQSVEFSRIMSTADINGDGFDEVFIFSRFPDYDSSFGKVYIYSYKKITDVKDNRKNIPDKFKLFQNYPNPFNPTTTIQYSTDNRQFVKLTIYDVLGREIVTLINEEKPAGAYRIEFDASKYNLSSGVYFCEFKINGISSSRIKMVLIK